MFYAFDLDGTLVDSRATVLQAYRLVGVEPPPDFFYRPWKEWLHDEEKHQQKNAVYLGMLKHVKPLPLMSLYHTLICPRLIMTGASKLAAMAIATKFSLDQRSLIYELSVEDKIRRMNAMRSGIMFEDQLDAATKMRKETQWTICHTM